MHTIAIRGERFESPWFRRCGRGQRLARSRFGGYCLLYLDRRIAQRGLRWHLLRRTPDVESEAQRRRQATHQIANIGPRKARRKQLLDLPRTSLLTQLEQLRGVLRGQVLPQQTQRRSVQRAARHHRENLRMIAAHPRRRDMPTRGRLTQPERHHAILEQRREPEIEENLSLVQLRQVRQKLSRDLVTPPD